MNNLKKKYMETVVPKMLKEFGFANVMQVPTVKKVVVNSGIGAFKDNRDAVEAFSTELGQITGQKPSPRQSRKSEAGFKIKKGETIGYTVTLRGDRMWAFLEKFIGVALPRVRDFRGLSDSAFDDNGNYSAGVKEHVIFPEINPNVTKGIRSLQVNIVMNASDKIESKFLLKELGIPFKETKNK